MAKDFTITVISKACGVPSATLRMWEKRYNAFSPKRDENGLRLYGQEDLNRAKMLAALILKGHAISHIVNLSPQELRELLDSSKDEFLESVSKDGIKILLQCLKNFDLEGIQQEIQYQRMSIGAKEFIFKIVLPVMQEIGEMVEKKKCSITQEHIVSSIVRDQLSKISLPNTNEKSKKFALATPEGNLHELPILMADILCKINRIQTNYLGPSNPASSLAEAVSALKCETIVMGVTSSDKWNYKKEIIQYLKIMDRKLKVPVTIIMGGGQKMDFPKFSHIKEIVCLNNFEEFDRYLSDLF